MIGPGQWSDLADSELRVKLEQRDVPAFVAKWMVEHRDMRTVAARIDRALGNRP